MSVVPPGIFVTFPGVAQLTISLCTRLGNALGAFSKISAAIPATMGLAILVPLRVLTPSVEPGTGIHVEITFVPGAKTSTAAPVLEAASSKVPNSPPGFNTDPSELPKLENIALESSPSTAPTVTTSNSLAGWKFSTSALLFPAATTTVMPSAIIANTAVSTEVSGDAGITGAPRLILHKEGGFPEFT